MEAKLLLEEHAVGGAGGGGASSAMDTAGGPFVMGNFSERTEDASDDVCNLVRVTGTRAQSLGASNTRRLNRKIPDCNFPRTSGSCARDSRRSVRATKGGGPLPAIVQFPGSGVDASPEFILEILAAINGRLAQLPAGDEINEFRSGSVSTR